MKQLPFIISIAALAIAGMALYKSRENKTGQPAIAENKGAGGSNFRIAYFEMDSIETNYQYVKESYAQVKSKEEAINNELAGIERGYQKKISEWQQKGAQMTQAESQQAQKEYGQMQQSYQSRKATLEQELTDMRNKKLRDIQTKIEEYLKEYNKQKEYAYVFSYEPAFFIYYKDSAYNITPELLKGLNEEYSKSKTSAGTK
ncbi:MAG TPA: OmpH family outer membrane protein [Chitinophagaceae bacterium]|nr:OmpH family outer membrane protein [Chitinophagaceae bacterium]